MRKELFIALFVFGFTGIIAHGQETLRLYNPEADARTDIQQAVQMAGPTKKHVLLQIGGNWCPWCIRLHDFFHTNPAIDSILAADYILVRVNFSKENKNPEVMAQLGYPQRFGFPVLVVLNGEGRQLHTQNTGYLEEGKSYSVEKVADFLKAWNYKALDPSSYNPE